MNYRVIKANEPEFLENHLNLGDRNEKEEIRVNSRFLVRNGKPWIPVMGEIHYARVQRETWERELAKMKAGGITVISTYIIWIYHEEEEGKYCFSGNHDLNAFLTICQDMGLDVILRVGPWVHGEVRNGGLPDWLLNKGIPLRNVSEVYLGYVKKYFERIYEEVKEFLFCNNGCVVGIQLENELVQDAPYLMRLKEMVIELGMNVPIYTVTGWNSKYGAEIPENDVLPVFGGYPEAPWSNHTKKLQPSKNYFFISARNDSSIGEDLLVCDKPDSDVFNMKYERYPFATCELGGGIQPTWKRRPIIAGDDVSAIALIKLGCGNNMPGYYMYHGGTNKIGKMSTLQESKESNYPNDYPIISYDFQAAIGEYGQIRDQYYKLKLQHMFLRETEQFFAPMTAYFQEKDVTGREDVSTLRYSVRTDGKSGFVFVNNYVRLETMAPHENVKFEIECEWAKGEDVLVFPENGMTINNGDYFVMPFGLDMNSIFLKYSTAQLICHREDTWFFFAPQNEPVEYTFKNQQPITVVPGIENEIRVQSIEGTKKSIRIVTMTREEAEHLFEINGKLMYSNGNIYEEQGNAVCYCENQNFIQCSVWNGKNFEKKEYTLEKREVAITYEKVVDEKVCVFPQECLKEHYLEDQKDKTFQCYRITVGREMYEGLEDAFLDISYSGDVAQIYSEGELLADDFCTGVPWRVGISQLFHTDGSEIHEKEVYLLISNLTEDIYLEIEVEEEAILKEISYCPVYRKIF